MKGLVEVAGVQENPFGPSAEQGQTVTKSLHPHTHCMRGENQARLLRKFLQNFRRRSAPADFEINSIKLGPSSAMAWDPRPRCKGDLQRCLNVRRRGHRVRNDNAVAGGPHSSQLVTPHGTPKACLSVSYNTSCTVTITPTCASRARNPLTSPSAPSLSAAAHTLYWTAHAAADAACGACA